MIKNITQLILQKLLGLPNYLFVFSLFKIFTLWWDKKERDFFHFVSIIPANGIILDIGANIGIMTVILAKKKRTNKIFSFEPIPINYLTLKKVVDFLGLKNISFYDYALGNENKSIEMVMPVMNKVAKQGLSHVVHTDITDFNEGKKYKVQSYRLDNCRELWKDEPVTAIKIDVENFEYFVFSGAQELLIKHRPLIYCELWENENRERCFGLLKSIGYEIKILWKSQLIPFDKTIHTTQNFFFIPNPQ